MKTTRFLELQLFKLWLVGDKRGNLPFHLLGAETSSLPRDDRKAALLQIEALDEYEPVASTWKPLPTEIKTQKKMPTMFFWGTHHIAVPNWATAQLTDRFPHAFEWLALQIVGEKGPDFKPPVVSQLSEQVREMNLQLMHLLREVRLMDVSQVVEFEPLPKKSKREIAAFAEVSVYGLDSSEIRGLDIFFVKQDLAILCTGAFRAACSELKLEGVDFQPVRAIAV
jgi:hypothetical protein